MRRDVDLPVREPFDAPGLFGFLAARAVTGVEVADVSTPDRLRYARTLALPCGPGAVEVVATHESSSWRVRASLETTCATDIPTAIEKVRHLCDLDRDVAPIEVALSRDRHLAPLVTRTPGIRVPGATDPHEIVVRALVGRQISVAAARTHLGRLTGAIGTPVSTPWEGLDRLFPDAARIAASVPVPGAHETLDPTRPLRLPRRAIASIVTICRALSDGSLDVRPEAERARLREDLLAQPGIGPWTAAYIAMRVTHDPDVWLDRDVALLAAGRRLGLVGPAASPVAAHRLLSERARAWSPWRSYAVMHLWREASPP